MRRQRTDDTAAAAGGDAVGVDHTHPRATFLAGPRNRKAENTGAPDRHIGHCQASIVSPVSRRG